MYLTMFQKHRIAMAAKHQAIASLMARINGCTHRSKLPNASQSNARIGGSSRGGSRGRCRQRCLLCFELDGMAATALFPPIDSVRLFTANEVVERMSMSGMKRA